MGIRVKGFNLCPHQGNESYARNLANPIATILSAVRDAVDKSMDARVVTEDIAEVKAFSASDVGDWIAENI